MWLVVAAVCTYAIGYRFYSKFIAVKVLVLDAQRATPAERLENGRDFVPTNKWVVFGHHFAAIAGPGPLVGPVLAAQFGYLPGTLWILAGAVFGGCVQDFVILLFSVRRDGKSLTEMARDEVGRLGGLVAYMAVISIIVILLGVCALVVVNALKASPWGTFTIAMTIPIALLMGVYLRTLRPGKVLETSALGFVLVMLAIWGGQWVSQTPSVARWFTSSGPALAILIIIYGFAASALPVWLLLAPRDYLSTFVKLGTIALLALGIVAFRPVLHMPPLTRFIDGSGPVFAGNVFPFAFITIACGAISGFHCTDFQRHNTKADPPRNRGPHGWIWRDDGRVPGSDHGNDRCLRTSTGNLFRDQQPGRHRWPGAGSWLLPPSATGDFPSPRPKCMLWLSQLGSRLYTTAQAALLPSLSVWPIFSPTAWVGRR